MASSDERERLIARLRDRIIAVKLGARVIGLDFDLHLSSLAQAEADAARIADLEAENAALIAEKDRLTAQLEHYWLTEPEPPHA